MRRLCVEGTVSDCGLRTLLTILREVVRLDILGVRLMQKVYSGRSSGIESMVRLGTIICPAAGKAESNTIIANT